MKKFLLLYLFIPLCIHAQRKTEKLVVVTLDGMRWQEIFLGIDPELASDSNYASDKYSLEKSFGGSEFSDRREKLFPFLWKTIGRKGQLYGNRSLNCNVDNANPHWFSYPGYNEIFTGYPDSGVNSNDKVDNPNENVLEFINRQPAYAGKVAIFGSWDVFPFIFNRGRSRLFINVDKDTMPSDDPVFDAINRMQHLTAKQGSLRPDVLTYMSARDYLRRYEPGVLYISFDETDHHAHMGEYEQYIKSAHEADKMLADLWGLLQSLPSYAGKTSLLITTDHGRGDIKKSNWRHHGKSIEDAGQIWFAVIGPDITPKGEIKGPLQLYQMQLASTLAKLLGMNFTSNHFVADPLSILFNEN